MGNEIPKLTITGYKGHFDFDKTKSPDEQTQDLLLIVEISRGDSVLNRRACLSFNSPSLQEQFEIMRSSTDEEKRSAARALIQGAIRESGSKCADFYSSDIKVGQRSTEQGFRGCVVSPIASSLRGLRFGANNKFFEEQSLSGTSEEALKQCLRSKGKEPDTTGDPQPLEPSFTVEIPLS